jgi:hypothetical protein
VESLEQRRPPAAKTPLEPQRTMQLVMSGLGAVIMLAICGLSGFFIIAEERRGHGAEAAGRSGPPARDISTRDVDPVPLTLEEVFPEAAQIKVAGSAYRMEMTHIDTDCDIAATGDLGPILKDHSCTQVVRASMTAPYGNYHVTAGLFNLADQAGAAEVGEQVRQLVETGGGTFAAMAGGGPGTDPRTQPLSQVGWHDRGHFLLYCVISRPDGQIVPDGDLSARRITADLIESYLGEQILGKRARTR